MAAGLWEGPDPHQPRQCGSERETLPSQSPSPILMPRWHLHSTHSEGVHPCPWDKELSLQGAAPVEQSTEREQDVSCRAGSPRHRLLCAYWCLRRGREARSCVPGAGPHQEAPFQGTARDSGSSVTRHLLGAEVGGRGVGSLWVAQGRFLGTSIWQGQRSSASSCQGMCLASRERPGLGRALAMQPGHSCPTPLGITMP